MEERRHADGVAMGCARKRRGRDTGGSAGWQERRQEIPLRGLRRGGNAGPPWGEAGARGKRRRPAVKCGRQNLGSAGKQRGKRGLWSGPQVPWSGGGGGGGCKASGVVENPGGGATEWVGESSRLRAQTLPEWPRGPGGEETPGGPTAAQDRQGEDRRGRGGGKKNPPTVRATRRQGADGSNGALMGGERTAESGRRSRPTR